MEQNDASDDLIWEDCPAANRYFETDEGIKLLQSIEKTSNLIKRHLEKIEHLESQFSKN